MGFESFCGWGRLHRGLGRLGWVSLMTRGILTQAGWHGGWVRRAVERVRTGGIAANLGGKEVKLPRGSVRESQTWEENSRKGDVRSLGSLGSMGGTKMSVLEHAEEEVDATADAFNSV
jgi:hypothetical protein